MQICTKTKNRAYYRVYFFRKFITSCCIPFRDLRKTGNVYSNILNSFEGLTSYIRFHCSYHINKFH